MRESFAPRLGVQTLSTFVVAAKCSSGAVEASTRVCGNVKGSPGLGWMVGCESVGEAGHLEGVDLHITVHQQPVAHLTIQQLVHSSLQADANHVRDHIEPHPRHLYNPTNTHHSWGE